MKRSTNRSGAGKPRSRFAIIGVVVLLVGTGAVVTATAAPGPSSDVKSAQYGGPAPKPNPNAPSGKCTLVAGQEAFTCQKYQNAYKRAKKACKRKSTRAKRAACKRRVEDTKGDKFREYAREHKFQQP